MPTLISDLDGVIFDFDAEWTRRYNEWYVGDLRAGMPQRWDELHTLGGFETRVEFWQWWYQSGGFEGLPVIDGALEALQMVVARGWKVVYATNRPSSDWEVTWDGLARGGFPLGAPGSLVCWPRKWELPGDLFVEDAPHNLARMKLRGLRVDRPWNQPDDYPELGGMPVIGNLTADELLPWVEAVEGGRASFWPT